MMTTAKTLNQVMEKNFHADQPCTVNSTAIAVDDNGRVMLTPQMKKAYAEGMKQHNEGRCHSMEDFKKDFAQWL